MDKIFKCSWIIWGLFVAVFISVQWPVPSTGTPNFDLNRRVLFISAYHPAFPTFFQQVDGLSASFEGKNIFLDIEFMDSKRFSDQLNIILFKQGLARKLEQLPPYDVIVTGDDNALIFALEHQQALFNEIPIVFMGVNNVELASAQNDNPFVTGVIEAVSMAETIELMLKLQPEASRVMAIADSLPSGQADLATFYRLAPQFRETKFSHIPLGEMTWKELGEQLSSMGRETAVLLFSAYTDKTGKTLQFHESLSTIKRDLKIPLFHLWYHGIGQGILGGKVISHFDQAKTAGDMVFQIISGVSPDQIDVITDSPNRYVFDHEQLKAHDISRADLPAGSLIFNEPRSFYKAHKVIVWVTVSIFFALLMLIFFLIVNIFGRRKLEKFLRKSEEKYRSLFEASNDAVILHDSSGIIIDANAKAESMLGYKVDELKHLSVQNLHFENDRSLSLNALEKTQQRGYIIFESRFKRKDGSVIDVDISSSIVDKKNIIIQGIVRDITAKKQVEKRLWETTDRFYKIYNSHLDAIFLLNSDVPPEIIECNKAVESIFKFNKKDLMGKTTQVLHVDSSHLNRFQGHLHRAMEKDGYLNDFEFIMKKKDGTTFPSSHIVLPLTNDSGVRTGWVSVVRDLTERKRMKAHLQQAQKLESIGSLAGGIAHDFNNILFPILGFSELLLENFPEGSVEHSNIKAIVKAGKRGRDLVKQILIFSRQTQSEMLPVKVQMILKEALKLIRATIPTNIEIVNQIQDECGMILGDTIQIHQIAMNLITNAYHAVGEHGKIIVKLDEVEEVVLGMENESPEISLIKPKRYIKLTVMDDGCGIDTAVIDKIFDPYFTTKEQGKGTGLGLAVVFGIVKAHNGEIKVASESGKGTTFNVYFPMIKNRVNPHAVNKNAASLPMGNECILLVDDDEAVMTMETMMLERLGYRVTPCNHSKEALNKFTTTPHSYDLVMSDMTMPDMTGEQLARELLLLKPDVNIIICTGFSESFSKKDADKMGIRGFLMKPVVLCDMAKMVRDVLDNKR
ncbi:ABC transporter substrate binding protein [Desulfocicer vacuolatum]|uniref:ABC transporter substrate binding protein n=1 Tax=Desulfocicer vacuolatum TaxID=2298 RepID=UPI00111C8C25|nr:ABC transporter substrate binding protein [Desulfocicer vacuolatum]